MAVRILSGILVTKGAQEGTAVIEYEDNTLAGGHTSGVYLAQRRTAGDSMPSNNRFRGVPTYTLSLRELKIVETEWTRGSWHEGQEIELLKINTGRVTDSTLEIKWSSTSGSTIEEISYMIVGNV